MKHFGLKRPHREKEACISPRSGYWKRVFWISFLLTLLCSVLSSTRLAATKSSSPAAAKSAPSPSEVLTLDQVRAQRASIQSMEGVEEPVRKAALGYLDRAVQSITTADQINHQTRTLLDRVKSAPERIKELQAQGKSPLPSPDSSHLPAGTDLKKVEEKARQEELNLALAKTTLDKWKAELRAERKLPEQLSRETSQGTQKLAEIEDQLKKSGLPDEHPLVRDARRTFLLSEKSRIEALLKASQIGLGHHEELLALLKAERDAASREVVYREALVKSLQAQILKGQQEQASQARAEAEAAQKEAPGTPKPVQKELDINVKLSQDLEKITQEQATLATRLESQKKRLQEMEEEFALNRRRVESSVLTQTLSLTLREQRQALPSFRQYRRDSAKRQQELDEVGEALLEVEKLRRALTPLGAKRDKILQSLGPLPPHEATSLNKQIDTLLLDREQLLKKLESGYRRYVRGLQTLEFTEQQLTMKAREYADFLDAHLLWIRSSRLTQGNDFKTLAQAVLWAINPLNWFLVLQDLGGALSSNPASWVLGLFLAAVLFAGRRRVKEQLSKIASAVRAGQEASVRVTLKALVMTVYIALAFPFVMGFVGYQLSSGNEIDDFSRAAGGGLLVAAKTLAVTAFLYHFCRRDGVADVHFAWPEKARLSLRHNVLWVMQLLIPISFVMGMTGTGGNPLYYSSLGRFASIAGFLCVAAFFARVLRLSGGIGYFLRDRDPKGWMFRLRPLWSLALVGIPIVLAGLSALGYLYTTSVLQVRYFATLLFVLALSIAYGLIMKWISGTWRHLAPPGGQVPAQQGEEQNGPRQEESPAMSVKTQNAPPEEKEMKDPDEQIRTLVNIVTFVLGFFCLWAIWAPVLPALKLLGATPLWSYMTEIDGVKQSVPITPAHLVTALFAAALTVAAARSLPGVLELLLLNRLAIDTGARYAINTLLRYAIMAVGILIAFGAVGLSWSSIQWLVAALGVGLGFGLQEIVANFVCGLIILFERPIRVGDVVTIGDQTGRVTRIQIRATTVTDWDRRELIVPNKEFITGQLINWSLSDPITRIVVPVGVAYGSDTKMTEELLLKVARENLIVLSQPEPSALFLGFGDSSLNFELRVFVRGMDNRLPVMHQLHLAIDREFRKAGINIAFPQRDVHLDAVGPLEVHLVKGSDPASAGEK
jgi:potassium efflux system protein